VSGGVIQRVLKSLHDAAFQKKTILFHIIRVAHGILDVVVDDEVQLFVVRPG